MKPEIRRRNSNTRLAGSVAERAAEQWLQGQGLSSVARNYRCKLGEIDLVMRDGAQLVFVEVRLRRRMDYGGAIASVTRGKQQRVIRAAQMFLSNHPRWQNSPCRFDVVASGGDMEAESFQWEWVRDAFGIDC